MEFLHRVREIGQATRDYSRERYEATKALIAEIKEAYEAGRINAIETNNTLSSVEMYLGRSFTFLEGNCYVTYRLF